MKSKFTATLLARTWRNWTLAPLALVWLTGCASAPTVLTEYETVLQEVPVRIPVPDELLAHPAACEFPPGDKIYVFDLDEFISCVVDSLVLYYRQVEQIKALQAEPVAE